MGKQKICVEMCERPQRGAAAWWGGGIDGICAREPV